MPDQFTTVTTTSWGSRIKGALGGIVIGLILFAGSFPLLWWNEGRTVERHEALQEGAGAVISVSSERLDPANEGRLVHTTGTASTDETLRDAEFGISANGALRLRREVEMYQWQEHSESKTEKNVGGSETKTTTYRYDKTWSSNLISSSAFKQPKEHQNPGAMAFPAKSETAANARLGAFRLAPDQVASLSNFEPIYLDGLQFRHLPYSYRIMGDHLFIGDDPDQPKVGDLRIRFSQMPSTPVSIVAQQSNGGFAPYLPRAGGSILLIEQGTQSAEAMFKAAEASNTLIAWLLRLGGLLMMWIGLSLVFRPLSVIADLVPFIGSMIAFGTGTLAFLIALPLTLLTIAIAWMLYRPLLTALLAVVALGVFGLPWWMKRKQTVASSSAPPPPPPPTPTVQR